MNESCTTYTGPISPTIHVLRIDAGTVTDLAAIDWNRHFRQVCLDPVCGLITLMSPCVCMRILQRYSTTPWALPQMLSPARPGRCAAPVCAGKRARGYLDALRQGEAAVDASLELTAPDFVVEAEITGADAGKARRYGDLEARELWQGHEGAADGFPGSESRPQLDASEVLGGLNPDNVCEAVEVMRFALTGEELRKAVTRTGGSAPACRCGRPRPRTHPERPRTARVDFGNEGLYSARWPLTDQTETATL